jgi:hypothetical protein
VASVVRAATDRPLPLPGHGRTVARWQAFADLAQDDLCTARLVEAHADAVAILAELDGPGPPAGSAWGVWAAHPPRPALTARRTHDGWCLEGTKPWCSGARLCTHALVTADADDGYRLFAVDLAGTVPQPGTWHAQGMGATDTLSVGFPHVAAAAVGGPGAYLHRPGFWHGAIGVAACWWGGAVGIARALLEADLDPHGLAHLGAVDAGLTSLAAQFAAAAAAVDADPLGPAERRALQLRARTEQVAVEVLDRVGRALGPRPIAQDARHAALVADLPVYLRQSHAEKDLARLGTLVRAGRDGWLPDGRVPGNGAAS